MSRTTNVKYLRMYSAIPNLQNSSSFPQGRTIWPILPPKRSSFLGENNLEFCHVASRLGRSRFVPLLRIFGEDFIEEVMEESMKDRRDDNGDNEEKDDAAIESVASGKQLSPFSL